MRNHPARTTALPQRPEARLSVQRQSNSRGWLHRVFLCKRHQMRHLCDLTCLLAKQVLSQLSYTPTREATLILKHFPPFRNPVLRIFVVWSEPLF